MPRYAWWVMLAAFLLGGCAARSATKPGDIKYILVGDAIPNDWKICVPLWEGAGGQLQCMQVHDFRVWMRRRQLAD